MPLWAPAGWGSTQRLPWLTRKQGHGIQVSESHRLLSHASATWWSDLLFYSDDCRKGCRPACCARVRLWDAAGALKSQAFKSPQKTHITAFAFLIQRFVYEVELQK